MIHVTHHGILLERTELPFEFQAVLNPGCILKDGVLHMAYRAVATGNYSSIGYARFKDHLLEYRSQTPILNIERAIEQHGLEDPRIVECDGVYYLFYVAYDGTDAQVMYATATELPHFKKETVISSRLPYPEIALSCTRDNAAPYQYFCKHYMGSGKVPPDRLLWEKDSFLFPRKINGKFALLYRLSPEIQVIFFDDFSQLTPTYWLDNFTDDTIDTVLSPQFEFENLFIGGGCPPIEVNEGWLLIYHAVSMVDGQRMYQAGVALLDKNDPTNVLARLPYPLFSPHEQWELVGDVGHVVFPSGAVIDQGILYIYYGAADSRIAYCSVPVEDLITELHNYPVT